MYRTITSCLAVLVFAATLSSADELEVLRRRYLEAKPHAIRAVTEVGATLPLRLFDDAQYTAKLSSIEDSPFNGFVWRGSLEDIPGGWVVMVEDNGCLVGTVVTDESYFRIRCLGNKLHAIEEVVPPEPWADDAVAADSGSPMPLAAQAGTSQYLGEDEIVEMDVLVVYTRKAAKNLFRESGAGYSNKKKAMQAEIKLSIAIANTVFENSEINIRLRLVKTRPVGYKGNADSSADLIHLQRTNDGVMDRVHGWRDRYGADFVSLIMEGFEPGIGGRGYQVPPSPDTDRWMFNVVEYDNLWWFTLAHEIGHNMGLAHDRDNDETRRESKSFRYSHGYRDPVGGFRTVMSYRNGCDTCNWRIPHFSNKTVQWQGAPTGNPDYSVPCGDGDSTGPKCGRKTGSNRSNCAMSLDNTREFYAAARPCQVRCGN